MTKPKVRLAVRLLGILLLLISAPLIFSDTVAAQMQPRIQQGQASQMNDRTQQLQWQMQEQARQMQHRQQLLLWKQQERLHQTHQR